MNPTIDKDRAADELRSARRKARLTQRQLAILADCSVTTIANWEQGLIPFRSHAMTVVRGVLADFNDEGRPAEGAPVTKPVTADRHDAE